jgi:hypothetical protein
MRVPTLLLALGLVAASNALTFTSPLPGSTVDLTSPLKITWIPSPSDPSTFTLSIINTLSGSSDQPQTLGTDIRTSSTSYTLPANTISSYGDGFELLAATSDGDSLAYSGAFSLAEGVYTLQTATDGVLTIVTSSTQESAPSATSVQSAAVTSSSGSGSTAVSSSLETSQPSAESAGPTGSTTAASPESSSARPSSTGTQSSGASASSTTSSAAATSSSSNSNLGFNSAASTVKGSVVVSYAAFVGALSFALLAY